MYCALFTLINAFPAADALHRIRIFRRIDIHRTDLAAFAAGYACRMIRLKLNKADSVEKAVKCAERAQYLAEKTGYDQTADHDQSGDNDLECQECACH